jgi:hypothetical protein
VDEWRTSHGLDSAERTLDPLTLERLKSLGYL